MLLDGSVAVVFGAAQGIGRAYVQSLLEHNVSVCMTDILVDVGKKVEKEFQQQYSENKIFFEVCDICDENRIKEVFDKTAETFGNVNIVVNNCGIIHEFDWQKCFDVNVGGNIRCFNVTRERLGKSNDGQGGAYIATASIAGLAPRFYVPVYTAAKHAVVGYLRSMSMDRHYKEHGIRVNAICPTGVNTQFWDQITNDRVDHAEEIMANKEPLTQMLRPEEVAKALIILLKDDTLNGKAMRVSREYGCDFATFEDQPSE